MLSDFGGSSIERELNGGERLLWKGRPRGGIRLRAADAFLIPFSLFWNGIVFFAAIASLDQPPQKSGGAFGPIFIIPFILIGLYMLIGRFFVDAMMRARTEYGLTSRRAIIVSGFFSKSVRSIDVRTIPEIGLTEKRDGSGTITFGATPLGWSIQRNPWAFGYSSGTPAFEMIEDVRSIYQIIDQTRAVKSGS